MGVCTYAGLCRFIHLSIRGSQKRVLDALEMEFLGGCELPSVCTGNRIQVLCKSNANSYSAELSPQTPDLIFVIHNMHSF